MLESGLPSRWQRQTKSFVLAAASLELVAEIAQLPHSIIDIEKFRPPSHQIISIPIPHDGNRSPYGGVRYGDYAITYPSRCMPFGILWNHNRQGKVKRNNAIFGPSFF
jgi:hypothetical protein